MIAVTLLLAVLLVPFFFTSVRFTNPLLYLSFTVLVFFIGKFFYNQAFDTAFLSNLQPDEITNSFYALALFFGIAYAIAIPLSKRSQQTSAAMLGEQKRPQEVSFDFTITKSGLTLCFVAPILLYTVGRIKGINPLENPLLFRELIQGGGMYYILAFILFFINILAIYIPFQIMVKKKRPGLGSTLAYLTLFMFAPLTGFGSFISYFAICPLLFSNVCYGKRIEIIMILSLPLIIFLALVYSRYRDTRFLSNDDISIVESFSGIATDPDVYSNALNRFDYLESFTLAQEFTLAGEPDWGASMLGIFVAPVPRSLWPEKPLAFQAYMTKQIYPDVYDIGTTVNFNALSEFTRSFGWLGIPLGGVFFGALLTKISRIFQRSRNNPFLATYYVCVVFPYLELGFAGGFINELALPVLILSNLFFALFIRRVPIKRPNSVPSRNRFMHGPASNALA